MNLFIINSNESDNILICEKILLKINFIKYKINIYTYQNTYYNIIEEGIL